MSLTLGTEKADRKARLTLPCPPLLVKFSTVRLWAGGCSAPRLLADRNPFLNMRVGHRGRDQRMRT